MTTILQARPRQFVSTPAIERVAQRALRYLESGYSVHLRGPAGTGKTTLALHLADVLSRPMMMLFGDDEAKTSDLVGNQSGYTRKKVVDNFIHSVVKMEDEVRQNWVDSRLTLACREGFTLIYDEFNRSRPETNNVLLSALEEKLLTLPPNNNRAEYIRVHPNFRVIFTSNPTEYCGVHGTQDALLDRLITINMPEPDELTQQEIVIQKTDIDRASAIFIVRVVQEFRRATQAKDSSGLRSCLIIAKICQDHDLDVASNNVEFRDVCQDILLSRTNLPFGESRQLLWNIFNSHMGKRIDPSVSPHAHLEEDGPTDVVTLPTRPPMDDTEGTIESPKSGGTKNSGQSFATSISNTAAIAPSTSQSSTPKTQPSEARLPAMPQSPEPNRGTVATLEKEPEFAPLESQKDNGILDGYMPSIELLPHTEEAVSTAALAHTALGTEATLSLQTSSITDTTDLHPVPHWPDGQEGVPYEREVFFYLQHYRDIRPSQIEAALGIDRFQTVNALRSLREKGLLQLPDTAPSNESVSSIQSTTPKGEAS